jgi:hypothetical protein
MARDAAILTRQVHQLAEFLASWWNGADADELTSLSVGSGLASSGGRGSRREEARYCRPVERRLDKLNVHLRENITAALGRITANQRSALYIEYGPPAAATDATSSPSADARRQAAGRGLETLARLLWSDDGHPRAVAPLPRRDDDPDRRALARPRAR